MTDDKYTINEPKDPFMEALEKLREAAENQKREEMGVNDAFAEIITFGSCSEIIGNGHDLVKEAFILNLPGIPVEEQKALYDKFEDLWNARRKQLDRSFGYVRRMYSVTEKEGDE